MRDDRPLDPTNRRLLQLLQQDGRLSATALGRALGLSRTAVQDRMRRLEAAGVIAGYAAIICEPDQPIDPGAGVEALLSVTITRRPCAPVLAWLRALPQVQAVFSVAGPVDAVIRVRVADAAALSAVTDRLAADPRIGQISAQVVLQAL